MLADGSFIYVTSNFEVTWIEAKGGDSNGNSTG